MGSELLLEIGTEEIPARFLPPVLSEMAEGLRKRLEQARIGVGEIVTWGTPRRLALVAREWRPARRRRCRRSSALPRRWPSIKTAIPLRRPWGLPRPRGWR